MVTLEQKRTELIPGKLPSNCRGAGWYQTQSGIYIDTGLGSVANTGIPAFAGIPGTFQNVLSCCHN